MQEKRDKTIKIRLTESELETLKEYSLQTGKSMSKLFRDFLEYQVKTNVKRSEES